VPIKYATMKNGTKNGIIDTINKTSVACSG